MNFSNLQTFMRTEIPILIAALTIFFGIKLYKNQEWFKFASTLAFGAVIIGIARGADIWSWVNTVLRWVGINI